MEKVIFEVQGVDFSYVGKYPALRGIDLTILQGSKVSVIGANGSGKSTLLHLLDGLIFPDRGTVTFSGRELTEDSCNDADFSRAFRRKVGLVFQNPDVQLFCPTVKEDIIFGPLQLGFERQEIVRRLDELASILKITHVLERAPHQLSVGEKRKVAIASTLMVNPEVLLLDEPTAGLDPLTTRHIIDLLLQANESGTTLVTSTHDLHIVEEISDVVHVFSPEKRIIKSGPPHAILQDTPLLQTNNLVHIHSHRHQGTIHTHPHLHTGHDREA